MTNVKVDSGKSVDKGKDWPQILTVLIACISALPCGFFIAWPSPYIVKITQDKINYNITEEQASYFTVMNNIGMAVFSPFFTIFSITDMIGRKRTLMLYTIPQSIAWILIAFSTNLYVLYFARFLAGLGAATFFASLPVYIGEITTPEVRGVWGNSLICMLFLGQFLMNVIGVYFTVQQASFICLTVPVIFLMLFSFMPESPYFYAMKGRDDETKKSLQRLRGIDNVEEEFLAVKSAVERQMSETGTWRDLVRNKSNRRALMAAVFLRISQTTTGFYVFASYTQYIFEKSGSNVSSEMSSIIYTGLSFILFTAASCFSDKFEAIYFFIDENHPELILESIQWIPLAGMLLFITCSSFGVAIVPTLMLGELFSASIKAKGMAVVTTLFGLSVFFNNYIFYLINTYTGLAGPFLLFGCCSILSVIVTNSVVPETKGKSLEEIQQILMGTKNARYAFKWKAVNFACSWNEWLIDRGKMTNVKVDSGKSVDKAKDWPQILAVLIACISALPCGFFVAWPSPYIVKITQDKINYNITEDQASYFTIMNNIGITVFSPFFTIFSITDMIGRKRTLMLYTIPQSIAWILIAFSTNLYVLYFARFLVGLGDATFFASLPVYIGEITTPEVRGVWGNSLICMVFLGQFLMNVIGVYFTVQQASFICLTVPVIFLVLFSFMPESPYFYAMKGRDDETKKALQRLRGIDNVEEEFLAVKSAVERQMSETGTWRDLVMNKSNKRALKAALFLRISQITTGFYVFASYTQYIFEKSGGNVSSEMSSIIYTGLSFVLFTAASCFSDKFEAIYFFIDQNHPEMILESIQWIPLAGMLLFIMCSSFGVAILPTLMLGELFSASIKAKGIAVVTTLFGLFAFFINYIFYLINAYTGLAGPFLLFGCCSIMSVIVTNFVVPETKGKSLEEIQQILMGTKNARL
ncbi:hypothetical protein JTB14_016787 [Gonioctena quinquepunctata]|nr:hypothetical protein JTB14_016787 [Gonioctena quinquepunctata]